MLYVVTLNYTRPEAEIAAHLESHKAWLVTNMKSGKIIAAGPLEGGKGGVVVVNADSRAELDDLLATDSYAENNLVRADILAFTPALRVADFSAAWAPNAKAI